jgi:hypothetical protein
MIPGGIPAIRLTVLLLGEAVDGSKAHDNRFPPNPTNEANTIPKTAFAIFFIIHSLLK